jgi:cyclopropane fatty-acyl-phospholipid synthase-like methyltransferase
LDIFLTFQLVVAIILALFAAYNVFHYVLFLLVTQPKDASKIGRELNQFEQRQLIEWTPQPSDFLKHDDEKRTYDDVFGTYRDEQANYSTCVFPRVVFSRPYEAEYVLLKLKDGMRLLDLGCGSGAAAYYLASRRDTEIVCVTNSSVQADICRQKFAKLGGRGQVIVTDFDSLDLPSESFDAIYALESIG